MQLGFFEAIMDLLILNNRLVMGGLLLIGVTAYWLYKRNINLKIPKITICLIYYYYLCIILSHIVGIPTMKEFLRLESFGEPIFNPKINLVPFVEGISLGFVLNIFCFIPLGFLCPLLSNVYKKGKNMLLLGLAFSVMIEMSQMFTLYRATDIDDLIANVIGVMLGYWGYKLINKLCIGKIANNDCMSNGFISYLPIIYIVFVFVITFVG